VTYEAPEGPWPGESVPLCEDDFGRLCDWQDAHLETSSLYVTETGLVFHGQCFEGEGEGEVMKVTQDYADIYRRELGRDPECVRCQPFMRAAS
jgi:hypothetical protein